MRGWIFGSSTDGAFLCCWLSLPVAGYGRAFLRRDHGGSLDSGMGDAGCLYGRRGFGSAWVGISCSMASLEL